MARNRNIKLGHFIVEFATPGIGHIMKAAGCEFALFDLEHSGFGFETVKSAIRYFEAADVAPIVRVPSNEYHHIARACDMGAEGIMIPMVGNAREAKTVVDCMKYYPMGKRGVALGVAHDNYSGGSVPEKLAAANERTTLFCQIETAEGARTPMRLRRSMVLTSSGSGITISRCRLAFPANSTIRNSSRPSSKPLPRPKKHKKSLGRLVPTTDLGIALYKQGFDFCCYSGDVWVLRDALTQAMNTLREAASHDRPVPRRIVR